MVDRVAGVPAALLRPTGGRLDDDRLVELTRFLALWIGLGQ
jgi:hypothetical protein